MPLDAAGMLPSVARRALISATVRRQGVGILEFDVRVVKRDLLFNLRRDYELDRLFRTWE
jgi:hypothetical protein